MNQTKLQSGSYGTQEVERHLLEEKKIIWIVESTYSLPHGRRNCPQGGKLTGLNFFLFV